MTRSLRSNSSAPNIWPIDRNMAEVPPAIPAPVVAPAPAVIWTENPDTDDFNPGTSTGQKIFQERARGHPDGKLFSDSFKDAAEFQVFVRSRAVALGRAVSHVPVTWNDANVPIAHMSIITQYQSINQDAIIRAAHKRYGNELAHDDPIPDLPWTARDIDPANEPNDREVFYDRVRSNVINKFLDNTLDPTTLDNLRLSSDLFSFTDGHGEIKEDGPTKLYLLLKAQDPSTIVNIENHRRVIESIKLQDHNNNVKEMIETIQKHYKIIKDNNGEYGDSTFRRHIFDALQTGPNPDFNKKIGDIKAEVESGIGHHKSITPTELLLAARTYYTNLVSTNQWEKIDPKDARIMTLSTKLEQLEKAQAAVLATQGTGGGGGGNDSKPFVTRPGNIEGTTVAQWRAKYVGQTIEKDGETWKWCTHHKSPGKWDGLYWKDHDTNSHASWHEDRKRNKGRAMGYRRATNATNGNPGNNENKALQVSDKLKTALATNLCVSEEDIARIINEAGN